MQHAGRCRAGPGLGGQGRHRRHRALCMQLGTRPTRRSEARVARLWSMGHFTGGGGMSIFGTYGKSTSTIMAALITQLHGGMTGHMCNIANHTLALLDV